ncbi:MAG: LysM peptidoglycan-binding domain-containing protein [Flavobacteriaceae bacterium]|nr:LysM peptidoglycan-binding domain-containing protein [Flavobacteriaceae bacterium]
MVKAKYQAVLTLGEQLKIQDGDVKEENGVLHVNGTAANQYDKNLLWNAIKTAGGEEPTDIIADIKVADTSLYAKHVVESGDSLSRIAKHYYGEAMKYTAIFDANRNLLDNPDVIHPGQELVIPNL